MADKTAVLDDATTPITALPPRPALNPDPVFKEMWEEKRGPVKSLGEAGLTKTIIAYQDRNGVLRTQVSLISHETCEAVVGLLNDEQLG